MWIARHLLAGRSPSSRPTCRSRCGWRTSRVNGSPASNERLATPAGAPGVPRALDPGIRRLQSRCGQAQSNAWVQPEQVTSPCSTGGSGRGRRSTAAAELPGNGGGACHRRSWFLGRHGVCTLPARTSPMRSNSVLLSKNDRAPASRQARRYCGSRVVGQHDERRCPGVCGMHRAQHVDTGAADELIVEQHARGTSGEMPAIASVGVPASPTTVTSRHLVDAARASRSRIDGESSTMKTRCGMLRAMPAVSAARTRALSGAPDCGYQGALIPWGRRGVFALRAPCRRRRRWRIA